MFSATFSLPNPVIFDLILRFRLNGFTIKITMTDKAYTKKIRNELLSICTVRVWPAQSRWQTNTDMYCKVTLLLFFPFLMVLFIVHTVYFTYIYILHLQHLNIFATPAPFSLLFTINNTNSSKKISMCKNKVVFLQHCS